MKKKLIVPAMALGLICFQSNAQKPIDAQIDINSGAFSSIQFGGDIDEGNFGVRAESGIERGEISIQAKGEKEIRLVNEWDNEITNDGKNADVGERSITATLKKAKFNTDISEFDVTVKGGLDIREIAPIIKVIGSFKYSLTDDVEVKYKGDYSYALKTSDDGDFQRRNKLKGSVTIEKNLNDSISVYLRLNTEIADSTFRDQIVDDIDASFNGGIKIKTM